jgi:outer membrane receptor protein involved in Fe transport
VTSDIRNVADLTVLAGIDFDDLDRFGVRLSGRYVGDRLDTDFTDFLNPGDVRYPEFLIVDLTTSLRLADRYSLSLEAANLTNENYYEVRGYSMPGRELRVGIEVGW